MRERTRLEQDIGTLAAMTRDLSDNIDLIELGETEGDGDVVAEAEAALKALHGHAAKEELQTLLSGEADGNDCYLEVHAGAGGTEAQDWTEMLVRMYVRWAEDHGHKVEWLEY
jgi:peptide chain release factor 2